MSSLYTRILGAMPPNKKMSLEEICKNMGSKPSSYIRMMLFAMPEIVTYKEYIQPKNNRHDRLPIERRWRWVFERMSQDE